MLTAKKSIDRSQIFTKYIETINNLFTGDVDTFKDVTFLRNYEAVMRGEEQSKEIVRKEIPPSNMDSFTKNDILIIQDAYLFFCDNNEWDYSTVEVYNRENLKVYVEFNNTANAKGCHDFVKRLRQYKGIIYNTFLSNIDDHYIGKVRKDLLDNNFIADIDRYVFIKIFKGCYLLKEERIRWLKNLDTLNYFIKKIKHNLSYQKESTTFLHIIGNCFADKKGRDLNLKTLTKATKIDNYKDLKVKLDKTISLIK